MLPDPQQVRLCALIRTYGSLAAAAGVLGVTTAAVSAQVARAERDWGTRLVDRGPRGATLTPLGTVLADAGDIILATVDEAERRFRGTAGEAARRLRIATFQTMAEYLLPPALTAFRHRRPDAKLSLLDATSNDAPGLVAGHHADAAVVAVYPPGGTRRRAPSPPATASSSRLTWRHLFVDSMVVCLPNDHTLLRGKSVPERVTLRQLRAEPWIVVNAGQPARAQFDAAAHRAGFTARVVFETDSYSTAQVLAGTGIGVTAISRSTVRPTPEAVHLPLTQPRLSRHIYLITRPGTETELQAEFIRLVTAVAAELHPAP